MHDFKFQGVFIRVYTFVMATAEVSRDPSLS